MRIFLGDRTPRLFFPSSTAHTPQETNLADRDKDSPTSELNPFVTRCPQMALAKAFFPRFSFLSPAVFTRNKFAEKKPFYHVWRIDLRNLRRVGRSIFIVRAGNVWTPTIWQRNREIPSSCIVVLYGIQTQRNKYDGCFVFGREIRLNLIRWINDGTLFRQMNADILRCITTRFHDTVVV